MFCFKEEFLGGPYSKLTIYDEREKTSFSVCPEAGGCLLDVTFEGHQILDGYVTKDDIEERSLSKSAVLFPFPNRLKDGKFEWKGETYQFPLNDPRCKNAIHGFVRFEEFRVRSVEITNYMGAINLILPYRSSRPYFPFDFDLEISYSIQADRFFNVDVTVTNVGTKSFPFGFGWHPYFKFDVAKDVKDIMMKWPVNCNIVDVDERMLPTGSLTPHERYTDFETIGDMHYDNCILPNFNYKKESVSRIFLKDEDAHIEVSARGQDFPFFQVFTPPNRNAIAIEHMTCNVNAFNTKHGIQSLKPDKEWKAGIWIKYQPLHTRWMFPYANKPVVPPPTTEESNSPEPGPAL
jgi:aldose 1-epimerase